MQKEVNWHILETVYPTIMIFNQKNPRPEQKILMGSKVMQGSTGVIWGQISLGMPYDNQIWSEEPQTGTKDIDGVKDHAGINWDHLGSNFFRNAQ